MESTDAQPTEAEKAPEPAALAVAGPRRGGMVLAWLGILIAVALAALAWFDARSRIDATQADFVHRLRAIEAESRAARAVAQQAQESARESQAKLEQLESRLTELQSQKQALEALYRDLSRNRDEVRLAEIQQVLITASQQLQLSGNVHAALLALRFADARLARAEPQLLPIRRAIAHDIERLSAAPALDLAGLSLRIDGLVAAVDSLPLAFDERAKSAPPQAASGAGAGNEAFFARLGAQVWSEIRQLVVLRKMDKPEPPLLPPSQSYFLRQNLRLRLLNARLSLLMHDEVGYRADLGAAQAWLGRYFDVQSKAVAGALAQLAQLSSVSLDAAVPSISESLEAVRSFKARRAGEP